MMGGHPMIKREVALRTKDGSVSYKKGVCYDFFNEL